MVCQRIPFPLLFYAAFVLGTTASFQNGWTTNRKAKVRACATTALSMAESEDYSNKVAELLSNFIPKPGGKGSTNDPFQDIDFDAPKTRKMSLDDLARELDRELRQREWFVTGQVNPIYFSNDFVFQDPDVRTEGGIEG